MLISNYFALFFILLVISCDSTTINKSLTIQDREKVKGDISSVNGNIRV